MIDTETKLYRITKIVWDCDGEDAKNFGLPTECYLMTENEGHLSDDLSDVYGFCIWSCDFEEVKAMPLEDISRVIVDATNKLRDAIAVASRFSGKDSYPPSLKILANVCKESVEIVDGAILREGVSAVDRLLSAINLTINHEDLVPLYAECLRIKDLHGFKEANLAILQKWGAFAAGRLASMAHVANTFPTEERDMGATTPD